MEIEILRLQVLSKERADRDDSNPLIIQTSPNIFWLINVAQTIKNIDKELIAVRRYGDLGDFYKGISYRNYLMKLRDYLSSLS